MNLQENGNSSGLTRCFYVACPVSEFYEGSSIFWCRHGGPHPDGTLVESSLKARLGSGSTGYPVASEVRNLQPQWDRQLSGLGETPASWRLELLSEMLSVLGSGIPSLKHVVWGSKCHKGRDVASYRERNQMLGPNLPSQGPRSPRAVSHPALDSGDWQLLRTWAWAYLALQPLFPMVVPSEIRNSFFLCAL